MSLSTARDLCLFFMCTNLLFFFVNGSVISGIIGSAMLVSALWFDACLQREAENK
jgi:hypothetical protein